jgi:L-cystine uptake protein TcyP (sodium:dicarboxylate symporter family)
VAGTTVEADITGAVAFTDVKAMAVKVTNTAGTRGVATNAKVTLAAAITGEVAMIAATTAVTPEAGMDSTAAAVEDITEPAVHTAVVDTGK